MIPLSIRPLVEKKLATIKSLDPHAVLTNLLNNQGNLQEEQIEERQRLRLDVWDMPGSTSSSGITHQVAIN